MRKGDVRIIVGVRSMRPSIMHDRQNDVSPRSTSAAILLLNKACVYLCIVSNGHSTKLLLTRRGKTRRQVSRGIVRHAYPSTFLLLVSCQLLLKY